MSLLVTGVLGVMTMHSCQSTSTSSPANPLNFATNGVAGACANQRAVAAAGSPDDAAPPVTLPPDLAAQLQKADPAVARALGNATTCTTSP